ncbi:MAG: hypothetical protein NW224_16215, partial [Leptolyngbyaceae cyanobacterium bins.302]|nr:hypothetical protein [Leptolyngbyaceae cyanobacterium bins.302]
MREFLLQVEIAESRDCGVGVKTQSNKEFKGIMAKVATKPASNGKTTSSNGTTNGKAAAIKDTSLYGKLRAAIYSSRAFSRAKLPISPDAEVY